MRLNLKINIIAILLFALTIGFCIAQPSSPPNFIIIFTDDQGYGDLGCYGHPSIKTPNIDRMAVEGQRWTSFYVAANVCTPSRAALLTGRHVVRSGMYSTTGRRVLFPDSDGGLPSDEITIGEHLQRSGYKTACIGKWHLGHLPQYLPTSNGFDYYFGIPYSNDMDRDNAVDRVKAFSDPQIEYFQVPIIQNTKIIERPADQSTITKRYTEETLRFISENKRKPFFIYLAHSMPHVPLFASQEFQGKSERGLYGDTIEEIDWSVGQILNLLKKEGLEKNTIVMYMSDNGPWMLFEQDGGSAGSLFGAKGTSYEGGVRVPAIFWGPGKVKPAVISGMGSTLDILPTIASFASISLPADREYDGYDLKPVLTSAARSPRTEMIYYHDEKIFAARKGDFKLYFYRNNPSGYPEKLEKLDSLTLFNLQHDPSERYNLASSHPDKITEIRDMVRDHQSSVKLVETQLDKRIAPATTDK